MLETTAQIIVEDQLPIDDSLQGSSIQIVPISGPFEIQEGHSVPHFQEAPSLEVQDSAEIGENPNLILEINLDGQLVGAPGFNKEEAEKAERAAAAAKKIEDSISVSEDDKEADDNDARKSKKSEKWDWESKGAKGFLSWVKARINDVPKHSGYDTAGLERAVSYFERLDNEISKAMRLDLEGELDADQIEHVRTQIEKGLEMLNDRIDKVKESKKGKKKTKKRADDESGSLVKEAQKITGVQGIYVTVPLLISRVARVCINGMVSGGHDIEDLYARQVKKYKLSEREQAETMQLLSDMGYALRQDRGFMPDDDLSVEEGMDWNQNFKG